MVAGSDIVSSLGSVQLSAFRKTTRCTRNKKAPPGG
jgi:hypothetical protein